MSEPGYNILLVEDDLNLGFVIQDNLKMEGYTVHLSTDGSDAVKKFNEGNYDLCILDIMLPKQDGFAVASDIRKINQQVPIFFLTAKSMQEDKVKGFQLGGDDYLTKPFDTEEFLLRVKALLRRTDKSGNVNDTGIYTLGKYEYDTSNFLLQGPSGEKKLTKKEAAILKLLCEHRNNVLPRELVLNTVWGENTYYLGRSLDVFISKLRKYLSGDSNVSISNVHGIGFKLEVKD